MPKWLDEDKKILLAGVALPTCGEKCIGEPHFLKAVQALARAHLHIEELRMTMAAEDHCSRTAGYCPDCPISEETCCDMATMRDILNRDTPPVDPEDLP